MPDLLSLSNVRKFSLPLHSRADGELSVLEKADLPFPIARVFFVRAAEDAKRGQHAHKLCNQFMMCVHGAIELVCDDGKSKRSLLLDTIDKAVLVPASLWASQIYRQPQSVLMVACDRPYEEADYVRDYDEFLRYRGVRA